MNKVKVLIVEDMALTALGMVSKIKKLGYEVVGKAESGEDAITAARESQPDVILMDINIKGMNGLRAAGEILRELAIPIVFTSAYTDDTTRSQINELGVQYLVSKPYDNKLLAKAIEDSLNSKSAATS
ncbi:MAG: response regulator [Candidatus Zixiibacteriota bacterium]